MKEQILHLAVSFQLHSGLKSSFKRNLHPDGWSTARVRPMATAEPCHDRADAGKVSILSAPFRPESPSNPSLTSPPPPPLPPCRQTTLERLPNPAVFKDVHTVADSQTVRVQYAVVTKDQAGAWPER